MSLSFMSFKQELFEHKSFWKYWNLVIIHQISSCLWNELPVFTFNSFVSFEADNRLKIRISPQILNRIINFWFLNKTPILLDFDCWVCVQGIGSKFKFLSLRSSWRNQPKCISNKKLVKMLFLKGNPKHFQFSYKIVRQMFFMLYSSLTYHMFITSFLD